MALKRKLRKPKVIDYPKNIFVRGELSALGKDMYYSASPNVSDVMGSESGKVAIYKLDRVVTAKVIVRIEE